MHIIISIGQNNLFSVYIGFPDSGSSGCSSGSESQSHHPLGQNPIYRHVIITIHIQYETVKYTGTSMHEGEAMCFISLISLTLYRVYNNNLNWLRNYDFNYTAWQRDINTKLYCGIIILTSIFSVTSLSLERMYIHCLPLPSFATWCGVQLNDADTAGRVRDLLPQPVDCKNTNGTIVHRLTSSLTDIVDVNLIFPISPDRPNLARYLPRGNTTYRHSITRKESLSQHCTVTHLGRLAALALFRTLKLFLWG